MDTRTIQRNRMTQGNGKKSIQNIEVVDQDTTKQDKGGNLLTESSEVLNRWAEYCKELYNFPIQPDPSILERAIRPPLASVREEVEASIQSLTGSRQHPGRRNWSQQWRLFATRSGRSKNDQKNGQIANSTTPQERKPWSATPANYC